MEQLTLDELRKKRKEAQKDIYLREGKYKSKIIVHMGTCGIAAGAREIVSSFLGEIDMLNEKDVMLTTSGCAGLCSMEPMATVELLNLPSVKYGHLTPEKTRKIFKEHILGGGIVKEYAIGIGSEKGG
ncbi:MAG: (2Fe-2S) ferredoxin domain-containing protein [Bacteroidales bacterium]|nr:(2Fe-2S) ferredoxin domain-containing protein [Bacteroidales bacterium]